MGKLVDMSKVAKLGGKARATKLNWQERREIARQGGLAARGKKRKAYKKRKKIDNKTQMMHELLETLHDHYARGVRVLASTPVGKGPDSVSQRVAELWRKEVKTKQSRGPQLACLVSAKISSKQGK